MGVPTEETIREAFELFESDLRKMGLYVSHHHVWEEPAGSPIIGFDADIGEVALGTRVQDPEQDSFDDEFARIETDTEADRYREVRDEIAKRLEQGRPVLGGDDED